MGPSTPLTDTSRGAPPLEVGGGTGPPPPVGGTWSVAGTGSDAGAAAGAEMCAAVAGLVGTDAASVVLAPSFCAAARAIVCGAATCSRSSPPRAPSSTTPRRRCAPIFTAARRARSPAAIRPCATSTNCIAAFRCRSCSRRRGTGCRTTRTSSAPRARSTTASSMRPGTPSSTRRSWWWEPWAAAWAWRCSSTAPSQDGGWCARSCSYPGWCRASWRPRCSSSCSSATRGS